MGHLMPAIFPRTTRRVRRIFTIVAALGFMGWPAWAAEVSQQPPPIYRETLAAWLCFLLVEINNF